MKKIDQFSDTLTEETLKEAADTFFGKRKEVEEDLELLHKQARELQRQAADIEGLLSGMNYILAKGRASKAFWAGLGHDALSEYLPRWQNEVLLPRAWTRKGRFFSLMHKLYSQVSEKIEVYVHGRYIDDPEIKGRKKLTSNLTTLKNHANKLNETIQKVNACQSPDEVMAFARRLDVETSDKKQFTGSGLIYDYDRDLCLPPLEMDSLGVKEYPELPADKQAMNRLEQTSREVYARFRQEIDPVLDEIYG